MTSRHKWYTLSGLLSNVLSWLAVRWSETPYINETFFAVVAFYGIIELFGRKKALKLFARYNARQRAKLRATANVSGRSRSADNSIGNGPRA